MSKNLSISKFIFSIIALIFLSTIYSCRDTKYAQGETLYKTHCQNCHLSDFKGLGKNIPSLENSFKNRFNSELSVCIIHKGRVNESAMLEMPSFKELSDIEFHNLVNYLSEQLGSSETFTLKNISDSRLNCTVQ